MENNEAAVTMSAMGANIRSIYDKRRGKEWLWNCRPTEDAPWESFDDRWAGGLDILFPCDEPCAFPGGLYGGHGAVWGALWEPDGIRWDKGAQTLPLRLRHSGLEFDYRIRLDGCTVTLDLTVLNTLAYDLPWVFRWHPAFALDRRFRLPAVPATCSLTRRSRSCRYSRGRTCRWRAGM